jgi:hypothetical protein
VLSGSATRTTAVAFDPTTTNLRLPVDAEVSMTVRVGRHRLADTGTGSPWGLL